MSDFAKSISKALKQVFPNIMHAKCFYHLKQNIHKNYPKQWKGLEIYTDKLGACISISQVEKVWNLSKKEISEKDELKDVADKFIDYFEKAGH